MTKPYTVNEVEGGWKVMIRTVVRDIGVDGEEAYRGATLTFGPWDTEAEAEAHGSDLAAEYDPRPTTGDFIE